MQTNPDQPQDQHVERIEPEGITSAGWQTQGLSSYGSANSAPVPYRSGRNNALAVGLIILGVVIMLGRLLPSHDEIMGGMVLLTIASGFLFFAFWRRIYGLLIPGSILAGLGFGIPLASLTNGVSVLWGLALGFLAIRVVGQALFNKRYPWPIIPAVILFCVGAITAIASLPSFFAGSMIWFPLLMIAAGLYLGWGRRTA
jgi:hypothetical protein